MRKYISLCVRAFSLQAFGDLAGLPSLRQAQLLLLLADQQRQDGRLVQKDEEPHRVEDAFSVTYRVSRAIKH